MKTIDSFSSLLIPALVMLGLSGCVDHANSPMLLPVGTPVNIPEAVHAMCVSEANAAYDQAKAQQVQRARIGGGDVEDGRIAAESEAKSYAHRAYTSCAASEGYRAVYN